jgi:hypothetical protein
MNKIEKRSTLTGVEVRAFARSRLLIWPKLVQSLGLPMTTQKSASDRCKNGATRIHKNQIRQRRLLELRKRKRGCPWTST